MNSQQLEIEDQAMKIRKKDIQISLINQKLIDNAAKTKSAMEKKNSEIISLKNKLNEQQLEILWDKEIFLASLKVSKKEISQNGSNLKLTGHKFPELAKAGHKKTKAVGDFIRGGGSGWAGWVYAHPDFDCGTKYGFETKRATETRPGFETGLAPSEHAKKHHFGELCIFGDSANTDSIRRAKGEPGQAPVPTPTFDTNKAKKPLSESEPDKLASFKDVNYLWGKILTQNGLGGIVRNLGNLGSK